MFKNINKISKLIINNNNNNNIIYLNICNYSKNHNSFTKRNSYTHKQDARATKRREAERDSEEMGGQVVGPGDIVTTANNPTISKPNHKHSKPITHKKKLEQLEHHHQKKTERQLKEDERLELIETLEKEKEIEHSNQLKKSEKERDQLNQLENEEKAKKSIRSKRQKKPSRKSATFIDSQSGIPVVESEGTTEYSDIKSNELDSDEASNFTFETDLSIGGPRGTPGRAKSKEFDISEIDPSKIIPLEEMSFGEEDPSVIESVDEPEVLSLEQIRQRFNLSQHDFEDIFKDLKLDEHFKTLGQDNIRVEEHQESEQEEGVYEVEEEEESEESEEKNNQPAKIKQHYNDTNEFLVDMFSQKYRSKEINKNPITINEIVEFMSTSPLDDFFVVDISNKCTWTKYLIVASSDSIRLLQNVQLDLISHFKHRNSGIQSDPSNTEDWLVVDLKVAVIHLFETKKREHYDLETLWSTRRPINYGKEESWDDELTSKMEEEE